MTETPDHQPIDPERIAERADLLPEETTVGSDDPAAQARIVLEDSEARTEDPEQARHESSQTPS